MRRRTFEEIVSYFNQTVSEMDIERKYKMTLLGMVLALSQRHDEDVAQIEPERKTGKWLPDNNSVYEMRFVCSECKESQVVPTIGFTKYKPIWDFCPNCGSFNGGENEV